MTAHTVGSSSSLAASPKSAPAIAAQASTAEFAQQLHAARQRGGPPAQEREATQQASATRDSADDRGNKSVAPRNDSRQANAATNRADKARNTGSAKSDAAPASSTTAKAAATASAAAPPVPTTAAPLIAETVADITADDVASGGKDADDDEQGTAALVGAMLALVGPAVSKVLPLGVADPSATSGKSTTADAGVVVLLQGGDVASMAVTTNVASLAVPTQWLAGEGLPLGSKNGRDLAHADAAPALGLSALSLAAPAAPVSTPVLVPAGANAFAQELGQQLTWFVDQGIQQARIRLHPDELGSLDLKISVNHGRVDVVFQAQHPGAVAAVQQSLPQLDQMLAQHGLSLGNTEVGQHDRGDQSGHAGRGDRVSEIDEIHGAGVVTPLSQLGLLDAFA